MKFLLLRIISLKVAQIPVILKSLLHITEVFHEGEATHN